VTRFYYDFIFQIDLESDSIDMLFCNASRYMMPLKLKHMSFSHMLEEMRTLFVCPLDDDVNRFLDFFNLDSMHQQARNSYRNYRRETRCRVIGEDGLYHMVDMFMECTGESHGLFILYGRRAHESYDARTKAYEAERCRMQALIGLPGFTEFFAQCRALIAAQPQGHFVMLVSDMDNFRLFQKIYGTQNSEHNLLLIAEDLKRLKDEYNCAIGYLGIDVFGALVDIKNNSLSDVTFRINKDVERVIAKTHGFQQSVGIYEVTDTAEPPQRMYDKAVKALSYIRCNDCSITNIYDPFMDLSEKNEQELLKTILDGIAAGEFKHYVQPICDASDGAIVSVEALSRWEHNGKILTPGTYIPLLEKTGYVVLLDRCIWEDTFRGLKRHMKKFMLQHVPLSLNVSRADVLYLDVAEELDLLAQKYEIEKSLVGVEITESAYVERHEQVTALARRLRERGFRVYLDDFGSGYSSLNSLSELQIDMLKLDMSFVKHMNSSKTLNIIRLVLDMACMLGLNVVTEGVETLQEFERLTAIGCRLIQGYYFYKPMSSTDFANLIRSGVRVRPLHTVIDEERQTCARCMNGICKL